MSEPRETFVAQVLAGHVLEPTEAIDDAIDAWHDADTDLALHDWLGMTEEEYAIFVEHPSALGLILKAHRFDLKLVDLLAGTPGLGTVAMAARGADNRELQSLIEWLRQTGRMSN